MDNQERKIIENAFELILKSLENKVDNNGTKDTPKRVSKAYEELLSGYDANIDKVINNALFDVEYDQIVIVRNIRFYSLCEHHMLPFFGNLGHN